MRRKTDMEIPQAVEKIINTLETAGFEAYAVGGCVRDTLLGREPEDWDITTSARPEQVKKLFRRTVDTGIQHGTVTVLEDHRGYEVTTYRIDGEYEDGRHPKNVEFTASLTEDLKRRDFTINAMAYSKKTGIVDEFGGMQDLEKGIIRCVGEARERFTEDALRILRAIRFSAQLGFSIEEQTLEAVRQIAPNLVHVSKERIQVELTKLLKSPHPERMSLVFDTGIAPYVSAHFADAGRPEDGTAGGRRLSAGFSPEKYVRWAAFLRTMDEKGAVQVLKELKLDNDTISRVRLLVENWKEELAADRYQVRKAMSRMSGEMFDCLLEFRREAGTDSPEKTAVLQAIAEEIRRAGDCVSLKDLAVTGNDLIAAGMKPGREIGLRLEEMLEDVLRHPEHNTKEYLLRF
ncbi:MAG TPA: CCA tRNA nucleotidyltransferase [Candidatus Lachnoclostridium stercorigallinarum]|uniref:CCA tRNA nucleotidyltransferase n=1 Tax=Candidatus Lachnoclostridium stercorigallinarum TaxID=2838634 RepID=A0A9D2K531_9FIRM|nr:CCA tRNA nucleotidyltransferase [Candidatus Lachnoclostridium stercorigallinarum]